MYGEDVEWALQARRQGLEVWIDPAATAVHLVSGGDRSIEAGRRRQISRVDFELRWFARRGRIAVILARMVLVVHALVRIFLNALFLPVRPRSRMRRIDEFATLLGSALARPRPSE
jgi:GT2 family glycosyltransferase